jgi:hypothetical protein
VRRVAVVIWVVGLGALAVLGAMPETRGWAIGLGLVLVFGSWLPYLRVLRPLRESLQLGAFASLRGWVMGGILPLVAWLLIAASGSWLGNGPMHGIGLLGFALWALGTLVAVRWARRRNRRFARLLEHRELQAYVDAVAALRRPRVDQRIHQALAIAALGDRASAVASLLQLRRERPRCRIAQFWAAVLLRDSDPRRAVEIVRALRTELPHNSIVEGTLASLLRYAGELDEAQTHIDRLMPSDRSGHSHAIACRIAIARSDRELAAAMLAEAERLSAGDAGTLVARAEYDILTRAPSAAESLERLREAVRASPFRFLDRELERLERLGGAAGPSAG